MKILIKKKSSKPMNTNIMKSLLFFIAPTIILIVACIIINVTWPYYIIAWAAGNGFGALALLTYIQLKDNSGRPYIKLIKPKKDE